MKSVTSKIWLAITLSAFFVTSCNKHMDKADQNKSVKAFSEYLGKSIEIDLKGKVLDTDQTPLDSVTIIVGDKFTSTDFNGSFSIKNVIANENLLTIKANKKGYKNELVNLTSKPYTDAISIVLYKESDLNLYRFNKFNYNLPPLVEE